MVATTTSAMVRSFTSALGGSGRAYASAKLPREASSGCPARRNSKLLDLTRAGAYRDAVEDGSCASVAVRRDEGEARTSNAPSSAQSPVVGAPRVGRRCATERVCPERVARAAPRGCSVDQLLLLASAAGCS